MRQVQAPAGHRICWTTEAPLFDIDAEDSNCGRCNRCIATSTAIAAQFLAGGTHNHYRMARELLLTALLAAAAAATVSADGPKPVQVAPGLYKFTIPDNKGLIDFMAAGDWGRTLGLKSMIPPATTPLSRTPFASLGIGGGYDSHGAVQVQADVAKKVQADMGIDYTPYLDKNLGTAPAGIGACAWFFQDTQPTAASVTVNTKPVVSSSTLLVPIPTSPDTTQVPGPGYTTGSWPNTWGYVEDDDPTAGRGGIIQQAVAIAMSERASVSQPQFIIGVGDSFYECGADSDDRFEADWNQIYGPASPYLPKDSAITNLNWWNVLGNHDVPFDSVTRQLNYNQKNARWNLPDRYYAVDYIAGGEGPNGLKVRVVYINTNVFVGSYNNLPSSAKVPSKYFLTAYDELKNTGMGAAGQAWIRQQFDFINQTLATSDADWNIVVGHHPVVSATGSQNPVYSSPDPLAQGADTKQLDGGYSGKPTQSAWTTLRDLLRTYNVTAYFNGHDHIQAYGVDPDNTADATTHKISESPFTTAYITTGGSSIASGGGNLPTDAAKDALGLCSQFIPFVAGQFDTSHCTDAKPKVLGRTNSGFVDVQITKSQFQVTFYSVKTEFNTDLTAETKLPPPTADFTVTRTRSVSQGKPGHSRRMAF